MGWDFRHQGLAFLVEDNGRGGWSRQAPAHYPPTWTSMNENPQINARVQPINKTFKMLNWATPLRRPYLNLLLKATQFGPNMPSQIAATHLP